MLSFLRDYGDVTFDEVPLCDVDRLVFAQLAYTDLQDAPRPAPLSEALPCARRCNREDPPAVRFGFQYKDDQKLCELAGCARRYAGVTLADYTCVYDPQDEVQFAAIALRLDSGAVLCVFRGTDNTLAGWKEDFNMAFLEAVPAQRLALGYLIRQGRDAAVLETIGHSKGGNLALYAAVMAEEPLQRRIRCAVSFDGPGLNADVMASAGVKRMQQRVRVIMPQASLIGRLFEQPGTQRFVESRVFSLLQHYPYYWKTKGTDFITAPGQTVMGGLLSNSVRGLMDRLSKEQMERIIEAVYDVVEVTNARTVNDLLRGWIVNTGPVVRKLFATDKETAALAIKVLANFFESARDAIADAVRGEQ